jgi:hypothetical protein
VKRNKEILLDFIIDELTNSIRNTISGDSFPTEISRFTFPDTQQILKKNGWNFNWKAELADSRKEIYKLSVINNSDVIQGLLSVT